MASLEVFGDEIAHLVLEEQKSRKQIYDHLVAKYGAHKGLSPHKCQTILSIEGIWTAWPKIKNH